MKTISLCVSTFAAVCFLILVAYLLMHPILVEQNTYIRTIALTSVVVLGGAIPSFILALFGANATLKITYSRVAFLVTGGYAIIVFSLWWLLPPKDEAIRVIELHEKQNDTELSLDLEDPIVDGQGVRVEPCVKLHGQKFFLICVFTTSNAAAKVTFTARANNIRYQASLDVIRNGPSEALGKYTIVKF